MNTRPRPAVALPVRLVLVTADEQTNVAEKIAAARAKRDRARAEYVFDKLWEAARLRRMRAQS